MAVKISDLPPGGIIDGTEEVPAVQGGVTVRLSPFQLGSRLTSRIISTPVAYFDLALPGGYSSFIFEFTGVSFSVPDVIAMSLSQNGGITFVNDTTNIDTYLIVGSETYGLLNSPYSPSGIAEVSILDSLVDVFGLSPNVNTNSPDFGASAVISFYPGNSTQLPTGNITAVWEQVTTAKQLAHTTTSFCLNPGATVLPSKIRATTLRIQPYGNGDANPPTSATMITAGSYIVWGVPQ